MDLLKPAKLGHGDWQLIFCLVTHRLLTTSDQQSLLQVIGSDGEWAISQGVDLCEVQWGMIFDAVQAERVALELDLRDPKNPDGDFERLHRYAASLPLAYTKSWVSLDGVGSGPPEQDI